MSSAWSSAATTAPTVSGPDRVTALDELDELVDDRARLDDPLVVAVEGEPVAAQRDRATEPFTQRVEHAVTDAGELGGDLVGHGEDVLHASKCRSSRMRLSRAIVAAQKRPVSRR